VREREREREREKDFEKEYSPAFPAAGAWKVTSIVTPG
jgi:hypothetical protein